MVNCSAYAVNRRIAIKCSQQLRANFGLSGTQFDGWFELLGQDYCYVYRPNPGEYAPIREGDPPSFRRTSGKGLVNIRLRDVGFSLEMKVDDARVRYMLEQIAFDCLNSDLTVFVPVTVYDFVDPGRVAYQSAVQAQLVTGQADPFRTRYGILDVEAASGLNGRGTQLYGVDGFRVVFKDRQGVVI